MGRSVAPFPHVGKALFAAALALTACEEPARDATVPTEKAVSPAAPEAAAKIDPRVGLDR